MEFVAEIKVMPLKELLDPQGKAVSGSLQQLGLGSITDVRIGKNITLNITAESREQAGQVAEAAAKNLLANPVMEMYEVAFRPS
jgi:phosphoribosylformylglycinamidine synthase